MRVIFAGSPDIAVPTLRALNETHSVNGVITNPDKVSGRGRKTTLTPVKMEALSLGLPLFQPQNFDESFYRQIREEEAECLIVFAYGRILPRDFIDIFPIGGINIHPSLLPKYRGPSPIPAAIINRDKMTGISIQKLAEKMDAGDILLQKKIPLQEDETTGSLSHYVSREAPGMLLEALKALEKGSHVWTPQNEAEASYCSLAKKEDGRINWQNSAENIAAMIRAYDPWPGCFTSVKGKILKILSGHPFTASRSSVSAELPPGTVLGVDKKEGILIQTQKGVLAVTRLQWQSKKPLSWTDFINGTGDIIGSQLGEDG